MLKLLKSRSIPLFLGLIAAICLQFPPAAKGQEKKPKPGEKQPDGKKLAAITLQAGTHARLDCPVAIDLPAGFNPWRPMKLVEILDSKEVDKAFQIERLPALAAKVLDGVARPASDRLWLILDGATPAGAVRRFELRHGKPATDSPLSLRQSAEALELHYGKSMVMRYNMMHVEPPKGVGPQFRRSGYIHPLMDPAGRSITDDFPADHRHHKGIWLAWVNTTFQGRKLDFWNLGDQTATVRHAGLASTVSGPVFAGFTAKLEHVDLTQPGGLVVLNEEWDVRLYSVGGEGKTWLFDLVSRQRCATPSPLVLHQYRYGGLGFRGARQWDGPDYQVLTSEGKGKADGHATRARWVDHSGKIDDQWSGLTLLSNPANPQSPEPVRIWDKGGAFFNWAPVQAGEMKLEPGKTYEFRYRFHAHPGQADKAAAERLWNDLAEPPTAAFEVVP